MIRHKRYYILLTILTALILVCHILPVSSSTGDRQSIFLKCLSKCNHSNCYRPNPEPLPISLQLFFWSCEDNCKYTCMHSIVSSSIEFDEPIHQYYGKWPFYRLLGIQEPASVLFSFLNGYMHYIHYRRIKSDIPDSYILRPYYIGYLISNMNTWLWSAVFHTRDTYWTEKLDYFSAAFGILYSCFVSILRIWFFDSSSARSNPPSSTSTRIIPIMFIFVVLVPFTLHVSYLLSLPRFDYTYNMIFNGGIGACHNLLWLVWGARNWKKRPYAWRVVACSLGISIAMGLEIFDFPPWWLTLDAHSLWHAATIPLIRLWYSFLIRDAVWESSESIPSLGKNLIRKDRRD
ncbi:Per1-like-domain-containing protein [Paraphysoderma sedebokerense]|nr:Per1-like-domain-containing protein [Paraphysoderma sedebokerense]